MHDWQVAGTMAHAEREAILKALQATNGDASAAARHLRIGRSTIYRSIKIYEIDLTLHKLTKDADRIVLRGEHYFIERTQMRAPC